MSVVDRRGSVRDALRLLLSDLKTNPVRESLLVWVDEGKRGDGYYLRVSLPDDLFPSGVRIVRERPGTY